MASDWQEEAEFLLPKSWVNNLQHINYTMNLVSPPFPQANTIKLWVPQSFFAVILDHILLYSRSWIIIVGWNVRDSRFELDQLLEIGWRRLGHNSAVGAGGQLDRNSREKEQSIFENCKSFFSEATQVLCWSNIHGLFKLVWLLLGSYFQFTFYLITFPQKDCTMASMSSSFQAWTPPANCISVAWTASTGIWNVHFWQLQDMWRGSTFSVCNMCLVFWNTVTWVGPHGAWICALVLIKVAYFWGSWVTKSSRYLSLYHSFSSASPIQPWNATKMCVYVCV